MEGGFIMKKKMMALLMCALLGTSAITAVANPAQPTASSSGSVEFRGGINDGVFCPDTPPFELPTDPDDFPPGTTDESDKWDALTSIAIDFGEHIRPVAPPFVSASTRGGGNITLEPIGGRVPYSSVEFARDDNRTADILIVAMGANLVDWHVTVSIGGFTVEDPNDSSLTVPTMENFRLRLHEAGLLISPLLPTDSTRTITSPATVGTPSFTNGIELTAGAAGVQGVSRPIVQGKNGIFAASFSGILGVVLGSVTENGDAQADLVWTFVPTAPPLT
jgi:hypothetical protein